MTYAYVGEMSVGACVPMLATTQGYLTASLNATLPELEARVAGMLSVQAGLVPSPPTIAAQIAAAYEIIANLEAGLGSISLDLTMMAAAMDELQAILGSLQASFAFSVSLGTLLATAGVYAWTYEGEAEGLVPGWAPGGSTTTPVWGIVLAASTSAAQTALKTTFGVGA